MSPSHDSENRSSVLADLRSQGWSVAVHNDYRLNGESYTFWLLTKGDRFIKGEGKTDEEALAKAQAFLETSPHTEMQKLLDEYSDLYIAHFNAIQNNDLPAITKARDDLTRARKSIVNKLLSQREQP